MKTCTKCHLEKSLSEFYSPKGRIAADGSAYVLPQCKACFAAHYRKNRARYREGQIRRKYDMSVAQYDGLMEAGCSVCGSYESLHMDHCHTSGVVRGVLCAKCNLAVGLISDSSDRARRIAAYLDRHNAA